MIASIERPAVSSEPAAPDHGHEISRERQAYLRRRGDDEAIEELILSCKGLVVSWLNKLWRTWGGRLTNDHYQDARAEMMLALVEAARTWDPERSEFVPYLFGLTRDAFFRAYYGTRPLTLPDQYKRHTGGRANWKRAVNAPNRAVSLTVRRRDGTIVPRSIPDRETPFMRLHGLESLRIRLLADQLDAALVRRGMAAVGLNVTELAFRGGFHPPAIFDYLNTRRDLTFASRVRLLAVLWPRVRAELEARAGVVWDGAGNPFEDLARQYPPRPRSNAPRAGDVDLERATALVHAKLSEARTAAGITAAVAARSFRVGRATWCGWERATKVPGRLMAPRLVAWIRKVLGPEVG